MYSLASLLQDYDAAVSPTVAGPTCAKCGVGVDLPDNVGRAYCSTDCLPAARQLDAEGLPLPEWKRGLDLGRR